MKNSILFASVLFLFACGTSKNKDMQDANEPMMVTATIGEGKMEDQPASVDNIKIKGNVLTMDVTYENACSDEQIMVLGSAAIMKSMPPIRNVIISRVKGSSNCANFITKKVTVDIKALAEKQESGSEIWLQIAGVRDKVKYVYE